MCFRSDDDADDEDSAKNWFMRFCQFCALCLYDLYDLVSDFLVYKAGNYLPELEGIYAFACILGVLVTFMFIVLLFIKTFFLYNDEKKKEEGKALVKGGIYMRVLLEDIPMVIVQMYNVYRGTKLNHLEYIALFFSIFSIYSGLVDVMQEIAENPDKDSIKCDN